MRLDSVRIQNFRGYADATIQFDELTALVGRNDAGKSTVLEALAIFFEAEGAKIESADVNKFGLAKTVEIRCVFSELPEQLVIDDAAPTTLAHEFLLNADKKLEIVKRWRFGGKTQFEIFAHAMHPTEDGICDMLEVKIDHLKARVEQRGLAVEDKRKAPLLRQALLSAFARKTLAARDIPLFGDGDGKKIWARVEKDLPLYVLFKADRSTSDEDVEAQDPMRLAVRQALKQVEGELEGISRHVKDRVCEVAGRTLQELKQIDNALASELHPTFKGDQKWEGLFKLSLTGEKDIPLNKRGSGVRRLVLLSFLLGEVARRRIEDARASVIVAIEEPETALHPKQQKLLVETLGRLSQQSDTQVILTTHAPPLCALLPHRSLRLVRRDGVEAVSQVGCGDETPQEIADELGVLPHPDRQRVRAVVCVEGPTDAAFLARASVVLRDIDSAIPDLSGGDPRILVLPLGGGTLTHWVEKRYLQNLNVREVHIYDRDEAQPPKYQRAVDKVNERGDGSKGFLTRKRELENYYPVDAISAVLGVPVPEGANSNDCDVCMLFAPARYELKHPGGKWEAAGAQFRKNCADQIKRDLAGAILENLTVEGLRGTGFLNELRDWMAPVLEVLQDGSGE